MSDIILFYQDKLQINGYFYSEMIRWSDFQIEVQPSLFFPKLTEQEVEIFRKDINIRRKVIKAVSRMLEFYGYTFVKDGVFQIKELKRYEQGRYIGLYSTRNYRRLTNMMAFLNKINMKTASSLIMLALCYAMHKDLELREKIKNSGVLKDWFQTQKYLRPYIDIYNINNMKNSECKFIGLKYTGNSCYQDSTLLALFAIPNDFITKNILRKDLRSMQNREISCGRNDYENRSAIQKELQRITGSMRGELPTVDYCSSLREILKQCPSPGRQAFYGTGTQDAGEFLQYIFAIFQVGGVLRVRTTIVTNDLDGFRGKIVNQIEEQTSPIVLIPAKEFPKIDIDYFLDVTDDAIFDSKNRYKAPDGILYRRRIERTTILKGDYIVFYAQRLHVDGGKQIRTYNQIIPSETIRLNKTLHLFAIVVHRNAHYTTYIKCEQRWFYYNDLSSNIVPIGTYDEMLRQKNEPSVQSEGVLYFYKS